MRRTRIRRLTLFCFVVAVSLTLALSTRAERPPYKAYTTAEGLAHDSVNKIYCDSRGFLWFCTAEGLSRFDGYRFKNYGQEQGLPHRNINDFLETRDGTYFVATSAGLAIFNPNGKAWVPGQAGLRRYPKLSNFNDLARSQPKRIYTKADGLFADEIFNLFEDSRGDICFTVIGPMEDTLRKRIEEYAGSGPRSLAGRWTSSQLRVAERSWLSSSLCEAILALGKR